MLKRLQQKALLLVVMVVTTAIQGMEQSAGWCIQTNDGHVAKVSEKNIKQMIRLNVLAHMRYKLPEDSLSHPLKAAMINRDQLCLLNNAMFV